MHGKRFQSYKFSYQSNVCSSYIATDLCPAILVQGCSSALHPQQAWERRRRRRGRKGGSQPVQPTQRGRARQARQFLCSVPIGLTSVLSLSYFRFVFSHSHFHRQRHSHLCGNAFMVRGSRGQKNSKSSTPNVFAHATSCVVSSFQSDRKGLPSDGRPLHRRAAEGRQGTDGDFQKKIQISKMNTYPFRPLASSAALDVTAPTRSCSTTATTSKGGGSAGQAPSTLPRSRPGQ